MKKGKAEWRGTCLFRSFRGNFPPPPARPISEPAGERKERNSKNDKDIIQTDAIDEVKKVILS